MLISSFMLTQIDLAAAIIREPLVVTPEMTVRDAIARMSAVQASSQPANGVPDTAVEVRASCAVVASNHQVVGLLTAQDIVRLMAQNSTLDHLSIEMVMTRSGVTLRESEVTDGAAAMSLLQQHGIRYLPIVNAQDQPIGLITYESLLHVGNAWGLHSSAPALERQITPLETTNLAHPVQVAIALEQPGQNGEHPYDSLAQTAPVGIFQTDLTGHCRYVNDRWCQMAGLTLQEALGPGWVKALHPDDTGWVKTVWYQAVQEQRPFATECRFRNRAGKVTWVYAQAAPERERSGTVSGYIGTITDISERKSAEILLRLKNELLAQVARREPLADILDALIQAVEQTIDGAIGSVLFLDQNHRLCHGAAPHLPRKYCQAIHGILVGEGVGSCGAAIARQQTVIVADIATDPLWQDFKDLALRFELRACWSTPISSSTGQTLGAFGIYYREVRSPQPCEVDTLVGMAHIAGIAIERQQAETALQQSEARWQFALEGAGDGVWDWHLLTNQVFFSHQWKAMLGYAEEDVGDTLEDWRSRVHPQDVDRCYADLNHYFRGDTAIYQNEHRMRCKDGRYKWVLARGKVVEYSPSGQPLRMIGTHTDISDRKQAEQELQQTEAQLRAAQRIAHLGNWYLFPKTESMSWSEEIFRILELDPQQIRPSREAFLKPIHPDDRAWVVEVYAQHLHDRSPYKIIYRLRLPEGRIKYVQAQCESIDASDGTPLRSQGILQDITSLKHAELEREQAEETLRQVIVGTATAIGEDFFPALVRHIATALGVRYASVSQATPEGFQVLAFFADGALSPPDLLPYCAVPCCVTALEEGECCHPDSIPALYPDNGLFAQLQVESYIGVGMRNAAGEPSGNLCILHDRPLTNTQWALTLLRIFATRAGAELERFQTAQALAALTAELEDRVQERTTQLRDREAQLENFFESANDLIQSVLLNDGRFEYVNRAWRETLGYTEAEISQLTLFDVLHPDYHFHCETVFADLRAGIVCTLDRIELIFLTKDGREILLEGSLNCRLVGDRPVSTHAIFRDITARRAAEQRLQEREARYRAVMDHASDAILLADKHGNIVEVNRKAADLLGYSQAELTQLQISQIHPPEVLEATYNHFNGIIQNNQGPSFETLILCQDGSQIPVDITGSRLELNGELIAQGIFRDIRDRKQAENALRESKQFLQTVLDIFPLSVFWKDQNSTYLGCNQNFLRETGLPTVADLIGKTDYEMPWGKTEAAAYRADDREVIISNTAKLSIIEPLQSADGERRWLETNKLPLHDLAGNVIGVLGTFQDISDRKRAEAQLRQTNQELARATRLKDEFLANMSHELRTPLNAILGMTEGLQETVFGEVTEQQRQALTTVERSASHLLSLINDILDVAKIEAGQITLDLASVALQHLCTSSLVFVKQQALKKSIQLDLKMDAGLPNLQVDERRVRQALINLLSNAIKFTQDGGKVTLQVSRSPGSADPQRPDYLTLAVIDTGIGIAPENINKLFQPFVQIDSALNRQYSGTGLGLALVKQIVELHGGKVGLTSELGVGSCFTVDLPCDPGSVPVSQRPTLPPSQPEFSRGVTTLTLAPLVLIAEDNEANISTFSSYLRAKGYRLLLANNGREAIAIAQAEPPDLILMDIQMPEMDGLTAIQQMRQDPSLRHIPIIALTALAMTGDRDRCLAAGANHYLAKPVKLKELITVIQTLLA